MARQGSPGALRPSRRQPVPFPAVSVGQRIAKEIPTELLTNLTLRELRGKYKRSVLGYAWSIINPIMNLVVYGVVFGVYLRVPPPVGNPSGLENYAFFLVSGLLPWTFLTNSLGGAVQSLVGNESLITKVYFPRAVLPTAVTTSHLVGFLVELGVLTFAFLVVVQNMVLPWLPLLVPLLALQFFFVLGIGLFLSVANAYFRDVNHFVAIFLNAWFYATPILYPASLIPDWARLATSLNPMTHFVDAYRDLFYDLRGPGASQWLLLTALAVGSMLIGVTFFRHHEPRLAEEL